MELLDARAPGTTAAAQPKSPNSRPVATLGTGVKLVRPSRRSLRSNKSFSATLRTLLAHRAVWMPPALHEVALAGLAVLMARFFYLVIAGQAYAPTLVALGVLTAAALGLKLWTMAGELFMPRPVVLLGVLPLGLGAIGVIVGGLVSPEFFGERLGLSARLIVILPLGLFVLRAALCARAARFAPLLEAMPRKPVPTGARLAAKVRETLEFWCN